MRIFAGGVVVALGLTLAGCATSSSSTPPTPPAPPAPNLVVVAPKDGSTVSGEPVTISISASNISDTSQLSVRLDGSDITSQLSAPDPSGVRSVQVSEPAVNYGKNQIQVRYQTAVANTSFTLNSGSAAGSPPVSTSGAVDPSTQLAGITTRVLAPGTSGTSAKNWGIQVTTSSGVHSYWSPVPHDQNDTPCGDCSFGYQIVLLSRKDLSMVWNKSYEVANYQEIQPDSVFVKALSSLGQGNYDTPSVPDKQPAPTECQPMGCIMVMQSLAQIGYNPCYNANINRGICPPFVQDTYAAGTLIYWLTKLGASGQNLFANGMVNPHVGYSFIGNAGNGTMPGQGAIGATDSQGNIIVSNSPNTGAQFERMGCLDTTYGNSATICDNLGRAGSADNAGGSTDLQQAGRISGVLIRDNYNLFTFSQSLRQMPYSFGTTVSNGVYTNVVSINGSTTEGAGQYTMAMPPGITGGFRLLILDRTHPDWANAKQYEKFYRFEQSGGVNDLQSLENDIDTFQNANGLIFLASMGDITHDNWSPFSPTWEKLVQHVQQLGGDPITVRILGDRYPAFNPDGKDDYLLVGKITANSAPDVDQFTAGTQSRFTAQESGYVINRHTIANASSPTQVEGVLVADHQGYYTPHMQSPATGIMAPQVTSLASASLLLPSTWPYSTADTVASSGQRNAYNWISYSICCDDIRSTYSNLNASPTAWSVQLDQLTLPNTTQTCSQTCWPFSEDDFNTAKAQLAKEFAYVANTRSLLTNILSLYQSEQSNVSLILTQAASDIDSQIDLTTPPPSSPTAWSILTSDVFPMISTLAEFAGPEGDIGTNYAIAGIDNAVGIGSLIIDNATDHSNDSTGVSQLMQALSNENIAESNLAQHEVNQYIDSLATLGNDFKRVVTNWDSLKAIGEPIQNGQLSWDPLATSIYLRAFDITTRRQFYPLLMQKSGNYFVVHLVYADDHYFGSDGDYLYGHDAGDKCDVSWFHVAQDNLQNPGYAVGPDGNSHDMRSTAWWPDHNVQLPHNNNGGNYPNDYWWDVWAIGTSGTTNDNCPESVTDHSLPDTFGMFNPINFDGNLQSYGLGLWKPYIVQYVWPPNLVHYNAKFNEP